jgi:hypothetical protein
VVRPNPQAGLSQNIALGANLGIAYTLALVCFIALTESWVSPKMLDKFKSFS